MRSAGIEASTAPEHARIHHGLPHGPELVDADDHGLEAALLAAEPDASFRDDGPVLRLIVLHARADGPVPVDLVVPRPAVADGAFEGARGRLGDITRAWDEVSGLGSGAAFTIPSVTRRIRSYNDPWRVFSRFAGTMPT